MLLPPAHRSDYEIRQIKKKAHLRTYPVTSLHLHHMRMQGPKRNEPAGTSRELHNEELHTLYSDTHILE
jgi:hypothetical protein